MATLKESSLAYTATTTKNISDLKEVTTDLELKSGKFTADDGKEVDYEYIELNEDKYRVPVSVKKSLKAILAENPELKKFKVSRAGEGMKTSYTVIPLA